MILTYLYVIQLLQNNRFFVIIVNAIAPEKIKHLGI